MPAIDVEKGIKIVEIPYGPPRVLAITRPSNVQIFDSEGNSPVIQDLAIDAARKYLEVNPTETIGISVIGLLQFSGHSPSVRFPSRRP